MKQLLTIFIALLPFFVEAQTAYYVSNEGSSSNNGTSTSTTWDLAKVNSFTGFVAGDQILFKKGETFYGSITVNNSGSSGSPITYGSYGEGSNPVITGFTTVSAWTDLGGNIWESSDAVSTLSSCKVVAIDNVNTPAGRYPNSDWLTYQSFSGGTSITSSSLTGTPDWTGATAVIKKFRYVIDVVPITGQSGSTLTYSNSSGNDGQNGYGFFIENDSRTLDTQNEWYYDPSSNKIQVYSASEPTNVKVSSLDNLFYISGESYIVVDGLDFNGANAEAFYLANADNLTVENCNLNFNYNGFKGYQVGNSSTNVIIQNNSINHTNNDAINLGSEFAGVTVSGNVITNTGVLEGMAASGQTRWGMNLIGNNYTIENNEVDSTGYVGIGFNGSGVLVNENFVNNFCLTADDGGGIYTGNNQTGVIISNNIILNGIGNYSGTTYTTPAANGIYCDDNSSGMTLLNNSIANVAFAAIFLHQAKDIEVRGNTTFNAHIGLLVDRDNTTEHTTGINVKNNVFVGNSTGSMNTLADQISMWFKTKYTGDDITTFGTVDSNYYARPIDDNNTLMGTVYDVADTYYTLSSWQSYTGYDAHSNSSPKDVVSPDSVSFIYNATSEAVTSDLPHKYLDAAANVYNGSITLAPYTGAVLIQDGSSTSVAAPTVSMSGPQNITADNTSIYAVPSYASGHSGTVAWTKVSGPGTTIIGSPTATSTTVSNLENGDYVFQCEVTQDGGQTVTGTVAIHVSIVDQIINIFITNNKKIFINSN